MSLLPRLRPPCSVGPARCCCWPAAGALPKDPCWPAIGLVGLPGSGPTRSDSLTRLGETALRSGEIDTAATLFEQAAAIDRKNVRALIGLGDTLLAAGRGLDASQAFERRWRGAGSGGGALRLCPGHARDPSARGGADHLRASGREQPSDIAAVNALGVAYDLLGQHDKAAETYRQGAVLVPASVQLRNNLGLSSRCRSASRSARAAAPARGRVRFHPADAAESGPGLRAPGRPRGGGAIGSHRSRR